MKRVWLNLNTGEFSESWTAGTIVDKFLSEDEIANSAKRGWKLIEYNCVNDENFELCDLMQIVTSNSTKEKAKKHIKEIV